MIFRTLLVCAGLLYTLTAYSQVANETSLVGVVTDATAKAVVGAEVSAVNQGTRDTYNTTTNEQGYYSIPFVRTGRYELTVRHPGFQTFRAVEIEVVTNQTVRTDVQLKLGEVQQTVTVEAGATAIRTDDASVSSTINTQSVENLPLNGRDPLKLATTTAGVIQGLKPANGVPPGQGLHRRGYPGNSEQRVTRWHQYCE